jgi:NAD(P)-dependent dehydrogenase (short-subunit alcohol dehydrogenase family)
MTDIAIVTGGGGGLGRELVLGLAAAGYGVVVADLDPSSAATVSATAEGYGVPAVAVPADVTVPADAERVVAAAASLGGPHVLINNAGGWTSDEQYPGVPASSWTRTLELNLTAPMRLTQLALAPMRSRGGGAVVNVASTAGLGAEPYVSPEYGAAKAGLIRFTTSMAATPDVRVMCVVPDWIGLPRAHAAWAAMTPAERASTRPLVPPADIVRVVLDLLASGEPGAVAEMWGGAEACFITRPGLRRGPERA